MGYRRLERCGADQRLATLEAPFLYRQEVDQETLQNRGYSLAIVFSSSNEGDKFEGAVGSTLLIDDVSIISQKQE